MHICAKNKLFIKRNGEMFGKKTAMESLLFLNQYKINRHASVRGQLKLGKTSVEILLFKGD